MMRGLQAFALVAIGLALSGPGWTAEDPLQGDLRELSVGMQVGDLPAVGYVNLACGNDGGEPGQALASWAEFDRCPVDAAGLREIAFKYDDSLQPWAAVSDKWEGTQVAGHPVIPSLLIDDQGVVQRIRIVTDPDARLYLKKKAFLLPIRVMGRYGRDGWACVDAAPGAGMTPVGGMFIDRRCEKTFHDRRLVLETHLYRTAEQSGQEFTDSTRLEIIKSDAG
jgi:hypothetical protein